MRNVGFSATKQEALAIHKGEAISLDRCELKKSRYGDDIEILVTNGCKVQKSPKKIPNLVESPENQLDTITLDKLQTTEQYTVVGRVTAKVLKVHIKQEIKAELFKQDVIIADQTGTALFTLWGSDIGKLQPEISYHMDNVRVHTYDGSNYLSGSVFEPCGEDVISAALDTHLDQETKLSDVTIATATVEITTNCIVCKCQVQCRSVCQELPKAHGRKN